MKGRKKNQTTKFPQRINRQTIINRGRRNYFVRPDLADKAIFLFQKLFPEYPDGIVTLNGSQNFIFYTIKEEGVTLLQ
jgi:hypothetical protein